MSASSAVTDPVDAAYELLAERAPHAIIIAQGSPPRLVLANAAAAELVGLPVRELLSLSPGQVFALIHPEDRAIARERQRARERNEVIPLRAEYRILRSDGTVRWVEAVAMPIRFRGERSGHVTLQDVTDRKATERDLQAAEAQQKQLEPTVRRLQLIESMGWMVGGVAHDFNNFLMGFLTNLEILRAEVSAAGGSTSRVDELETGVRRAAELCKQLIRYAGRDRSEEERLDLNDLVRDMTRLLTVSVPPKIRMATELAAQAPTIRADPTQVRQVVTNLVHNAFDAMVDCTGTVTVSTGSVFCDPAQRAVCYPGECDCGTPCHYVEVLDQGCGMTPETIARAFEPFFSTKGGGRGLGLATVLGIVRSHGGGLHIESVPGQGTTIRALFPAVAGQVEPDADPPRGTSDWRVPGLSILIVDDDALTREGLSMLLSHHGFQVLQAAGGREAVRLFEEHHHRLAAVVLDYLMPDLDGRETLARLRAVDTRVPVILSSGCAWDESHLPFAADEVAGVLRKPYEVAALVETLHHVLQA